MRRPSAFHQRGAGFDVKMTPLIDVVFLLMVFFVWTASFTVAERLLPSQVAKPLRGTGQSTSNEPPPPDADFDAVVVRVTWHDTRVGWQFQNQELVSLDDLRSRLQRIFTIHSEAAVIVHPDADTPLGHVIDVYDVARRSGFHNVKVTASVEPGA